MICEHRATRWVDGGTDDWTGERLDPVEESYSTCEDIDVGRFRCKQCGKVMYYTGLWRDFWEKGIPCPGSDRIGRNQ